MFSLGLSVSFKLLHELRRQNEGAPAVICLWLFERHLPTKKLDHLSDGRMRLGLAPRAVGRMPPKLQFGLALLLARRPAHLPLLIA